MQDPNKTSTRSNFRKFFVRGLGILLPTVVTIGILLWAYNLVRDRIGEPINRGVRELIVLATGFPPVSREAVLAHEGVVTADPAKFDQWRAAGKQFYWLKRDLRRTVLATRWKQFSFPLDLIGLIVAVVLIYMVGATLGSLIGRRLYHRGEDLLNKVPLIRQVYPSVKQVTDFFVGVDGQQAMKFSRVVAVEYPRKGLWSIGLVTGDAMQMIELKAQQPCVTVFVPSSPTPFTGYVITVPRADTIDLPVTIEQALRFSVSGGLIIPPSQVSATAQKSHEYSDSPTLGATG